MDEWIKLLLDQTEHSPEEKSDSDSDYMDESDNDETKTTNLCHQPSYNAEEMHIHLMTEKEKSTHIKKKLFEEEQEEKKKEKKSEKANGLEQLKKNFAPT
ncbi:hypothetical protein M0813_14121 [Anaeramoeba flamelloides]|uniref:Uncharacterized protein n=1 Tax=Anaeramoeba flamelloides TaxID=1746091 RepID=A0ABQ8Z6T8_9EUKA|nr:hypothetical protein M0813_14121 [Anaeramoeba flamelloides]